MKKLFVFLLILLGISCNNHSPYPGFSKARHGIYFQLHKIGEETEKAYPGDFITADIQYFTLKDSLFFKGRRKFQVTRPSFKGSVDECFLMLAENENATFIISADNFFEKTLQTSLPSFLDTESKMKIEVEILEIQTEEEYNKEKEAFLNWIDDFGDYEKTILEQFLAEKELAVNPTKSGLYQLILKEGTGRKVRQGDTITVNYEGKFLNGKYFDSTIKRNQPFQFVYGTEWQVVKGLEEAISMMEEGEKSLFILPSELAFGNTGSSTGIIPPFTSLIFEVELLKIN
ncbi:MAG: FKBP-type peptidyl-prolyl cis-trans isomerase [Bacteroidales bacterium]|nr:FKBP-type peptidyl-prolyl cis-trans isomerase [Bacteroidales bacterium]